MRRQKNYMPFIISGLACLAVLGAFLAVKYMPGMKKIPYREAMALDARDYFMVGGEPMAALSPPVLKSGVLYVPVDFVKEKLDPYIFWDSAADRLSITTESRVIRMNTENLNYFVNNEPMRLNLPVFSIDGQAYLPAEFLEELYDAVFNGVAESGLALVTLPGERVSSAVLLKKTSVRFEPDIKSPIVETAAKGDTVFPLEEPADGAKFIRVRTAANTVGYIPAGNISEIESDTPSPARPPEKPVPPKNPLEGKIALLWDQPWSYEDNFSEFRYEPYEGLDVLAPTWFSFDAEALNGDVVSIADKGYVDWAHENGYQVWALVTDNHSNEVDHAILSGTAARENAIKQLLALTAVYGLDGINVDFERVRESDAEYFLQFLRELGPLLHEQGASLSVDLYVPTYTKHYNRTEIGKVADYICVMAYDEHYSGSETSGPVASLPFVDKGVADTLLEVPKEKILMGLPFYTRVWREYTEGGEPAHTAKDDTMGSTYDLFTENGAKFTWLPDVGSHYGEYAATEEGESVTYRVWLEDARSIEEKLKIADTHGVAGVAGWKRGLETEEAWQAVAGWKAEG